MNKQLIRDLAIRGGIYDCICDPYDKLNNGDSYSSVMIDLERFAEKIVKECIFVMKSTVDESIDFDRKLDETSSWIESDIKKHFGVEE